MLTLDGIVRRGAENTPDRVAVIEGDSEWTWQEFDRQVEAAAQTLRALGAGPGSRIAAAGFNSAQYLALYYGVARLGAVICPLNYLLVESELNYVLSNFEPEIVLFEKEFEEVVRGAAEKSVPTARTIEFNSPDSEWAAMLAETEPGEPVPEPDPESIHVVMYTSGTTGRPKGVCHTQRAHYIDGLNAALAYGLRPSDRYVVHAPSFHAASWDHAKIFLIADGSVVITPRFDAVELMEATARHRATVLFGVPAVLRLLLNHPRWGEFDLSSLRMVYFGGALGSLAVLKEFADALGQDIDYVQIYGLTEGGPFVSISLPDTVRDKPRSIGRPIPGVRARIVDPESGRVLPDGEVGELVVRLASMMSGYWRNDEATAEAIRDGWLHTGDLAVRDADGDYEIVDRLKDMVRSGGENVYAAEVERVILEHPDVVEVAVIGLPDERWDERVVAVVLSRPGTNPTEDEIRTHCRQHLAAYKVPKQVEFVEDFPRTGLGKIAKTELRRKLGE